MEPKRETKTDRISDFFEQDHREIDAILSGVPFESPREALAPFKEFNRRLERHIHWEEGILFPSISAKASTMETGPIRVMKMEHEEIRKHKAAALKALREQDGKLAKSHTEAMLRVLKDHNAKEEQILYPACDQLLSTGETKEVMDRVRSVTASPSTGAS
ncbi:MAG: hemerythrin domain-containing protein [Elusimicrobia bacterium]|nr:hemerythrin domain-containing protein [Elusimicrobiota bacterium]